MGTARRARPDPRADLPRLPTGRSADHSYERMTALLRKLAITAAVLAASASVVSLPASPASATIRTEASVDGAWGYLNNIQFDSWTYVTMDFYLKDTSADGDHAQARVPVSYTHLTLPTILRV